MHWIVWIVHWIVCTEKPAAFDQIREPVERLPDKPITPNLQQKLAGLADVYTAYGSFSGYSRAE